MRSARRVWRGFCLMVFVLSFLHHAAAQVTGQVAPSIPGALPRAATIDPSQPPPLDFAQKSFPDAMVGVPFRSSVQAIGGSGLYNLSVTGDVPPGLIVESGANTVALGGVPTATGDYRLEITIADVNGNTFRQGFSIRVSPLAQSANGSPTQVRDTEQFSFTDQEKVFFPAVVVDKEDITLTDLEKGLDAVEVVDRENITLTDKEMDLDSAFVVDKESITLTDLVSAVIRDLPAITWLAPAPIVYGTPLSGTQLDASSPVAGTFIYTPPAGTVLTAGLQTLSVTLNPTNTALYAPATKTVQITVFGPAVLLSPTPGSTLTGTSATFTWSTGGGVTKYEFRLGTTGPGSSDVYNSAEATTTALTSGLVSNIPAYGVTLYARLYSWINGAWQYNDYTYTESGTPVPAALTSPTPGSGLTGSSATFTWSAGGGVSYYEFRLGTTGPGSSNVYNAADATTTALTSGLVSNIPTTGATLYARVYSWINGAWQYNDYTYSEFGPAMLISPTPGSTLTGSSATFTWTTGGGVTKYEFRLGTTGPGSSDVYNSAEATTTALTSGLISNIPTNAATLYARIYSWINGAWQYNDYTYTEFGTPTPAALLTPTPGSALTGSSATFTWSAGVAVTKYEFRLGTTAPGSTNVYNSAEATTTALTSGLVSNIPTNCATLYARLYSWINGAWQYNDYTYTEFCTPTPAVLTSPTPGSTLTGSSATFTWSAGVDATKYEFRLGTTGPGSTDVYNSAEATTTALSSGLVSSIPTTGATLYARIYSWINGAWQYNDYTYTESPPPAPAVLLTPTPGSALTGTSATFTWSAGVGVTKYEFRLGTTGPGSTDVYNSAEATTTALTSGLVSNIPTTGATLYARIYSWINGAWQYNDYTYTEAP